MYNVKFLTDSLLKNNGKNIFILVDIFDTLYDYDYNKKGLDHSFHDVEINPDRRELKNFLDILRSK